MFVPIVAAKAFQLVPEYVTVDFAKWGMVVLAKYGKEVVELQTLDAGQL